MMINSITEELCKLNNFQLGTIILLTISYIFVSGCMLLKVIKDLLKKEIPEWLWGLSLFGIILNSITVLPIFLGWLIKLVLCQ